MPNVGGVFIRDDLMPRIGASAERPGYGALFADAASEAVNQVRYGVPYALRKASGNLTPELEQEYQQNLIRPGGATPAGISDVTSGRVGVGRFIGENLIGSLPYMVGGLAGGLAGFAAGGRGGAVAGAIAGGTPQFIGSNVDRAVAEEGGLSQQSAARSLAVAPLQSAADAAIARFLPGAGHVLGDAAATQAGGFIRRTATSIAKAGATEAVTEAAQQVGERYAAGLPVGSADAVGEYVNAAVTAFAVGGVLGAGGGFRRTPAVALPAEQVAANNDTMNEHVDGVLRGDVQALPAPADFIGRADGSVEVNPGGRVQQALPAPEQFQPPDFIVDGEGRAAPPGFEGEQAIAVDRNQPRPVVEPPTMEDVQARIAALAPEQPNIDAPFVLRDPTQGGAAQLPTPRVDPATGVEIPFEDFLTEQKKGLRGGFVQSVQATDEMDLLGKVYDQVFTEQDTRANTAKFAQRLGILDENLQPTQLAQYIEEQRTAPSAEAQPVEASSTAPAVEATPPPTIAEPVVRVQSAAGAFSPEVEAEMDAARKAAGIERVSKVNAVNQLKTPADVFTALASDSSNAAVSQTEKLAQKLGLITDDDARDVTPRGREVFLTTTSGLEATVNAAQEQGYTGAQASMFERGVRAANSQQATEMPGDSFADNAAYMAGQVWAKDFIQNGDGTKTAAQTNAIQSRILARNPGAAAKRRTVAASRELTPEQVQRRSLNRQIDTADLTNVPDQEQVQLRRMVAEGATPEQVGQAIQKLQGGESIRTVPARPQVRSDVGGRGQPVFKEMYNPAENTPQKAEQRVQTEAAVRAYDLRSLIQMVQSEKAITEARAAKLNVLLDEGKVERVARLMKDFDENAKPRQSKTAKVADSTYTSVGKSDPVFEQGITGKSFMDAATYMAENAPSPFYRELMIKVRQLGQMLERQGMEFNFRVVNPNELDVPREIDDPGTKAITHLKFQPKAVASIYMKNGEHGADSAMNYQAVAHEMIHSVTMLLTAYGRNPEQYGKTQIGKATAALDDILRAVQDHLQARQSSGKMLNDFEQRLIERDNNALYDIDELLAWTLTNPEMQRYLNSIEYKPKQSVFSRLVQAIRTVLGMEPRYDSALAEVLRVSENVFGAPRQELRNLLPRNEPEIGFERERMAALNDGAASARNRTVGAANEATKEAAALLSQMADRVDVAELGAKARRRVLGWLSHNQIDRQYGQVMPGLLQHSDAHRERVAVRSRFEQMGDEAYQRFEKLERENAKAAEWVGQLMALTTEFQLDPAKAWVEHKHLLNDKNAPKLRQLHAQAVDMANKMRRGDGTAMKVFNEFRALNEAQNYARMAASLHGLVAMDPELTLGVADADINPVDKFMREEGLTTAEAIRDRWSDLLHRQIAEAAAFISAKKGEAARGAESDIKAMREHLSPIELQISAIHEAVAGMQKAPYFHLGRYGDYFGSATVRKINGQADPAALKHIAEALEKAGFDDVQISTDNTKPKIALRFDTLDQAKRFQKLTQDLQKQGWLDKNEEIKVGPRSRGDNFGVADGLPDFVQRYVQSIEASPVYVPDEGMDGKERAQLEKAKQDAVRLAIDTWLEQQPDSSISKVLVKRHTVPGYNKDMVRNFAHRWRVGSISIANVAAAPKFNQAFVSMRSQVNQAVTEDVAQATKLNDIMSEMKTRDTSNPINETADTFDKARALAHSYFLGLSPAYGLVNMTQLGVTALPELAKAHGYAKSFHAMRRASTTALKILKAATSEAIALGPKHWADVAITENVLTKAGLTPAERNFATHMLATGTIDIGSAARALGQIAENRVGSKLDMGLKYASAMGMYTETFSRLTTALAARELHGDKPGVEQYATKVVSNSMFDYQSWNTARALGKQGFAGPVTPILTQFMSYSVQLTEKLYSEALDAFQRPRAGETEVEAKERKTQARRFLAGHLVAVTSLAGTLGLPFATVFATVIERMVDALGDDEEPFDATAAWRGFLADVLGKEMGEVVSRGVPRAFGLDLSTRTGEQSLLPGSDFLADRRPWKEAVEANASRSLGAVPSMISNIITGAGKFADGDVLGGLKDMMPVAFKGPIETYRMTTDGYVDTRGNRLPMSPDASSYLWQLLGFSPNEKAEYQEARGDQQARRGEIGRRAERLRKQIVQAMITGDRENATALIADAQAFDQDNPAFAVVPSLSGALTRRMAAQTRARSLGAPLGVAAQDIAGQSMTRYANINYAQ